MVTVPNDLTENGWELEDGGAALLKTYKFSNFRSAMAWMLRGAFEAEMADHHPEWSNVYNRVSVRLTTHDSGGLTEKDIALAKAFDTM